MTALLNIGLLVDRPPVKYEIAATAVFKAMRKVRIGHVNGIVHQPGSEPTMVCEVEATDAQVYQLAVMLDQDCIAVWDRTHREGRLVGPRAAEWGEFDPSLFLLPSGRPLSETL